MSRQLQTLQTRRKTSKDDDFDKKTIELRDEAIKLAIPLKQILTEHKLNIVTTESVTSGLIGSTITDVGHAGGVLYGSFVVYDTDAKRKWLGVDTPNLYNKETAKQLAEKSLEKSRAMVGLSITGNATPYSDSLDCVGIADIALSIRHKDEFKTFTKRINPCNSVKGLKKLCNIWKDSHETNELGSVTSYPKPSNTTKLNNVIRYSLVKDTLEFALNTLEKELPEMKGDLGSLNIEKYDIDYFSCGEPSDPIINNLEATAKKAHFESRKYPVYSSQGDLCSEDTTKLISCPVEFKNLPEYTASLTRRQFTTVTPTSISASANFNSANNRRTRRNSLRRRSMSPKVSRRRYSIGGSRKNRKTKKK